MSKELMKPTKEELFGDNGYVVAWTRENYDYLINNGAERSFEFDDFPEAFEYKNPSIKIYKSNRIGGWEYKINTDISHLVNPREDLKYNIEKGWNI